MFVIPILNEDGMLESQSPSKLKILLAHTHYTTGNDLRYRAFADAARGIAEVSTFCVTIDPPGPALRWPMLDRSWKRRSASLMRMYGRLIDAAADFDVLLLYNGTNIHPEFLECLPTFNVYCSFDDPESSADTSEPVAASFDAVFYGNIASRFQYESWGCRKLAWLPIFTAPNEIPTQDERQGLLEHPRTIDISFVGERCSGFREQRLNAYLRAFPETSARGQGWPEGRISDKELDDLYRRTKIGINIHNSTGPVNRRMFALPAYGAMLLCDNKTGLGHIFELGTESVGFDTIPEAIEATRYYLKHDDERQLIAARGSERFWKDYSAESLWKRVTRQLVNWMDGDSDKRQSPTALARLPTLSDLGHYPWKTTKSFVRKSLAAATAGWESLNTAIQQKNQPRRESVYLGDSCTAYTSNPELAGVNMASERLKRGEPFEWPNILALNWAITALIGSSRSIVEIGAGTGPFARFAGVDRSRQIDAFENDDFARREAMIRCNLDNVRFFKDYSGNLQQRYDLLVSVEVIEHVDDLGAFLEFCARLAPRAIYSTPNRRAVRGDADTGPPVYEAHVREYDPGEVYAMLMLYYDNVQLFHMPDVHVPWLEPMTIADRGTPVIAECSGVRSR